MMASLLSRQPIGWFQLLSFLPSLSSIKDGAQGFAHTRHTLPPAFFLSLLFETAFNIPQAGLELSLQPRQPLTCDRPMSAS